MKLVAFGRTTAKDSTLLYNSPVGFVNKLILVCYKDQYFGPSTQSFE